MEMENKTWTTGFIILGFNKHSHEETLIYVIVLPTFFISILGNLGFLTLMWSDHHLHKPMYFFLSNLSFIDICNTTVTLSTFLQSLIKGKTLISFSLCMTQLYCVISLTSTEVLLLSAMAYDRYVAICHPLRYPLMMNKRICILLVAASWLTGCLDELPVEIIISQFSYCGSNEINHFFCDPNALLKLSCSDTHNFETVVLSEGIFLSLIPFLLTLLSYIFIIGTVLKIHHSDGRSKAFSTCSSHLTVILLFYGTIMCVYMRPSSMQSPEQDKMFALLYTVLTPMLNPIIYSLRNQEVKNALRKIIIRKQYERKKTLSAFHLICCQE
ncbi:olfactory receptor 13F1-like [Rhinatrema bivittatum]|uniref:olfactory receptor 13F1-like n=1 Tax=Rhinatrema bivittatum TaxID=194408 RepID=UPI001128AA52|nr:olfactory receptor 13F1-like [Rhinatrema bivittatum]